MESAGQNFKWFQRRREGLKERQGLLQRPLCTKKTELHSEATKEPRRVQRWTDLGQNHVFKK